MPYKDEMKVCESCGTKFVYTVEEQRLQDTMDLDREAPELCPDCREGKTVEPQAGLHPGVVKWFSGEKGFGFIVQADGSEVFFHKSNIVGDVGKVGQDGAHVWYELRQTDRGPEAYNVHLRE